MMAWLLMLLIGVPILLPLAVIWLAVRLLPRMKRIVDANRPWQRRKSDEAM